MTDIAVADTGPLIHLSEIESAHLLSSLDTLFVPESVIDELEAGGMPANLDLTAMTVVSAPDHPDAVESLERGESDAIAVADEEGVVLLTDDLAARDVAADLGLEVHGSVGVIALGFHRGRIDRETAADLMRSLQRETSLFVTDAVIEHGIARLEHG